MPESCKGLRVTVCMHEACGPYKHTPEHTRPCPPLSMRGVFLHWVDQWTVGVRPLRWVTG